MDWEAVGIGFIVTFNGLGYLSVISAYLSGHPKAQDMHRGQNVSCFVGVIITAIMLWT